VTFTVENSCHPLKTTYCAVHGFCSGQHSIYMQTVISSYVSTVEVEQMASKEFKGIYNKIILYIIILSSSKAL
jgi:hypothetical protein